MTRENIETALSQSTDPLLLNQLHSKYAFDVYGMTDIESILKASKSDYLVGLGRLALAGVDGKIVENLNGRRIFFDTLRETTREVENFYHLPEQIVSEPGGSHGVVRIDPDGMVQPFGTVGVQYTVVQNREIVRDALDIVENSEEEALLVYAGNYRGGRVFFAGIRFAPLVVKVGSFQEMFHRHLVVYSGHDGNLAHHCASRFDDFDAPGVIDWDCRRRKHYSGVKDRVSEAMQNLKQMKKTSDALAKDVISMAQIQLPPESEISQRIMEYCASKIHSNSTASPSRMKFRRQRLQELYISADISGKRGYNGWSLYRAYIALDEETRHYGGEDASFKLMQNINYGKFRSEVRLRILGLS